MNNLSPNETPTVKSDCSDNKQENVTVKNNTKLRKQTLVGNCF